MVKGEGGREGKASKCGNEKQGGKRGLTITEEKGRMAEEKREGLRTGVGGGDEEREEGCHGGTKGCHQRGGRLKDVP